MDGNGERDSRCLPAARRISRRCRHIVEDALFGWEIAEVEREFVRVILEELQMATCCTKVPNYVVKPHERNGWEKIYCRVCGEWIGDRPKVDNKSAVNHDAR